MANLGYLQLTRRCTQACRFCSNPPTGQEPSLEQLAHTLDELVTLGYDGVILTGGEPTLSPLFFDAIGMARDRALHVRAISNGQRLADRAFFQRCADAGLAHVHLSLHSHRPAVHDGITQRAGSWGHLQRAIALAPTLGLTCDLNTVLCADNADHLDLLVKSTLRTQPHIHHWVFNGLDPTSARCAEHPEVVPRLRALAPSLERALDHLDATGRSFRVERLPLCFMPRHAWAATETRKIIKEEERLIRFLDGKGRVRQRSFTHDKAPACEPCRFSPICAGLFAMHTHYDPAELAPVFDDPLPVVRRVLRREPDENLLSRLHLR